MCDYVPFELQIEIMKRLPVKSLIRFRSVSKPWKSIIHTSLFISDYNYLARDNQKLLVSFSGRNIVYILNDDNDNGSFPRYKFPLTLPGSVQLQPDFRNSCWYGIGYLQGLFGFLNSTRGYVTEAVIWNPSIRKYVDVSVPNVLNWPYDTVAGFGVCNATDPVIVKINYIDTIGILDITSSIPWQVEVFTLSSGAWRTLSNTPRKSLYFTKKVVVIDGFIYWLACDRTPGGDFLYNLILSFDIAGEVFSEISLPPSVSEERYKLDLSMLKESLVVLHTNIYAKLRQYDVWMMTLEDGVQHSLKKLYTVKSPDASIQRVLGFRKNGQPIIEMGYPYQHTLYVYEPDTEHFNDIGIFGNGDSCLAGSYIGMLLLLDHHK